MFVFENVLGLFTAKKGEPFKDLRELVNSIGYEMQPQVQNASEHGVLQKRQRVIIVGWLKDGKNSKGEHYGYPLLMKEQNSYTVLRDLFSDLPPRIAGEGCLLEAHHDRHPLPADVQSIVGAVDQLQILSFAGGIP